MVCIGFLGLCSLLYNTTASAANLQETKDRQQDNGQRREIRDGPICSGRKMEEEEEGI
jgi:hypothetical protein